MHAIRLKAVIDQTHRLEFDLPLDTPQGEVEVIVLVPVPVESAAGSAQAAPMHSLLAFLHDLDRQPLANPRSAAEIEAQIAETRASWD